MPEFRFDKKDVVRGLVGALACLAFLTFLGLYWLRVSESTNFAIVLFALLAVGALSSFAFYSRYLEAPNRTINAFPVVLLVFSLLFTVAIPPMASPDEGHHFFSSYWLSDAVLGQASFANSENFPVRSDVMELYEESSTEISGQSYRTVLNGFELFATNSESVEGLSFGFTLGSENAIAKVPSVLGILFARLLGMGAYPLFYMGRIFSVLFFVACCTMSVRLTPVAKGAFAGASLLPMTLQLAASYSYDSGIVSLAFLLCALLLRAVFNEGPMRKREMLSIVMLAALVAPLKVVYSVALVLLLFIPSGRFASGKQAVAFKASVILSAFVALLFFRMTSVSALVVAGDGLDYRGSESGHFYDLSGLLAQPLSSAALFFRSFDAMGDFYWESMIGNRPGWLQASLQAPTFLMVAYLVLLLLSAQKAEDDSVQPSIAMRAACIFSFAMVVLGVALSMTIGWTFDHELIIQGIQGRYFLPLLPLALLSFRLVGLNMRGSVLGTCVTGMSILNIVYLMRMLALAFAL